jgi:hypothetical protein
MEASHGTAALQHRPYCQTIPLLQGNDLLQSNFLSIAAHLHQVLKYGHTCTPRYRTSKIVGMYQFQSHHSSNIKHPVMIETENKERQEAGTNKL